MSQISKLLAAIRQVSIAIDVLENSGVDVLKVIPPKARKDVVAATNLVENISDLLMDQSHTVDIRVKPKKKTTSKSKKTPTLSA